MEPEDATPTPLTPAEAQRAYDAMVAKSGEIAFRYLAEGCECRSQLMIESLTAMGFHPGRAWAVSVGRSLAVAPDPTRPRRTIKWGNHTAPTLLTEENPPVVMVIDPSLPGARGPVCLADWATAMKARSVVVSAVPLSQAEILEAQRGRALAGVDTDAVVFSLPLGVAPVPESGGSGYVIGPDPAGGASANARRRMKEYLASEEPLPGD